MLLKLVAVTFAPLWVTVPFQAEVIVCPLAKGHASVQLVSAAVPVLLMVMAAPKPLCHWSVIV